MNPGTGKALTSSLIIAALSLFVMADPTVPTGLAVFLLLIAFMNMIGSVMMLTPLHKMGAILVIACSIPFVPVGVIGILGARQCLDHLKRQAFEAAIS